MTPPRLQHPGNPPRVAGSSPRPTTGAASSGRLMYQAHRALHECPGFAAFAQFHAGPEIGPIFVGLRADALEIYTTSEWQYLFDLEGRPVRFSTRNEYFFRGVSHQGTVARKRPAGAGGGLERFRLEP